MIRAPLAASASMLLCVASGSCDAAARDELRWRDARQLVLVTTPDWDSSQGVLQSFDRTDRGWRAASSAIPITVGRAGLAWGAGLHSDQPGPIKKEGDGRGPAGVFHIGVAFGYAASMQTAMTYTGMSESDYCVDVVGSPFYNQIVDARVVGDAAVAGSTEPMRRDLHAQGDMRYKLGFVIEHNADGKPGAGSCIFAHIWKSPGESTAGCTAMDEGALRSLVDWLRPDLHPIVVQLPRQEYVRLERAWQLPTLIKKSGSE